MSPEDLKQILAVTASVSTILQFLAGILICQKIVNKGSTGDISAFPFVSGCLSTSMWLRYGFLIKDTSLILVNTVGTTLFFAYVLVFTYYSIKKSIVLRQFLACLMVVLIILVYCEYEEDRARAIRHIGLVCCVVTLIFFAAPLASLLHVLAVKSADSMPFPIILATFVVCIQWFSYGVLLEDKFIQIPNFAGCLLSGFQLGLFYMFRKKYTHLESI